MVEHGIAGDALTNVQGWLCDVHEIRLMVLELLVPKLLSAPVLREKGGRVSGVGERGVGLVDTDALMAGSGLSGSRRTPRRRRRREARVVTGVCMLGTL